MDMVTLIETIASIAIAALFSLGVIFILKRAQYARKLAVLAHSLLVIVNSKRRIAKRHKLAEKQKAKNRKAVKKHQEAAKPKLEVKAAEKPKLVEIPLKYKTYPQQKSKQKEILQAIAHNLQLNQNKFSLSQILSEILTQYPETNNSRGEIIEELDEWVNEDPRILRISMENNVTYYQMKGGIA